MTQNKTFIIAEAGVNHNGSVEIAKELIDKAKESGADAVKFQSFKAENLVVKNTEKADYQKFLTPANESQYDMIKRLELNTEAHFELFNYCKLKEIVFISSPFDLSSIGLLEKLGVEIFKIPSGEINNLPYLRKLGKLAKKVILSTGMSNLSDIEFALGILTANGTPKTNIQVLHCNTEYPTLYVDVNLLAMLTIRDAFKVEVGYSDHTPGIEISIAAVALGAKVIEKHFTLDKNMLGPDHKASIEPYEFKLMVDAIRNVEKSLGTGLKEPSNSELKNIKIVRKSIVALKNINKGEQFSQANISIKRPGNGLSPKLWDLVLGLVAKRDFSEDEIIEL